MLLLLALLGWTMQAQHTVSGKVTDKNGEPLLGVEIYIEQLHVGTTTDLGGTYSLSPVPSGVNLLTFNYLGYTTLQKSVSLDDQDLNLDVTLETAVFHMDEVIVSTPFHKLQSQNVMKIETRSVVALQRTGAPTLAQSIATIPGVSELSTGNGIGKPVIRGLSGNRVLVYTQGVRLENQQFGNEHGLGLDGSGMESVEVIKGPASLLYGSDALGGVLYLNPEKFSFQNENEISLNQRFFSNTLGSSTSLGAKTTGKNWKFLARGNYNTHSDYKIPNGDRVTNSRFNEKDFKAGIGLNLENYVTEFRYNYNGSKIGIPEGIGEQTTSKSSEEPYQDLTTHILSMHNHFFLNRTKLDLDLGYIANVRKEFEHHDEEEGEEPEGSHEEEGAALDMDLHTLTYDIKFSLPKKERWESILGVQGMYQTNENSGEELLIPDAVTKDIGFLFVNTWNLSEKHLLQGGIRFDHRQLNTEAYETAGHDDPAEDEVELVEAIDRDFGNFTFSLGYKTSLFDKVSTRLNLASGFRAPNLAELASFGVHHGTNRFEVGNPDLKSENNLQTDLALEFTSEHIEVFANGFYNHLSDYIYAAPTGESEDGYPVYAYVQNDARLYGGEFGFHFHPHPWDWLHLESGFEMVVGKQSGGDYLPLIPANNWSNTIRGEFKGNGVVKEFFTALEVDSFFRQDKVSAFESETPGYNLVHLRFGADMQFKGWKAGVQLGWNNIFDKTYVSHLSALKYLGIPNPGRNLVVGVQFEFL